MGNTGRSRSRVRRRALAFLYSPACQRSRMAACRRGPPLPGCWPQRHTPSPRPQQGELAAEIKRTSPDRHGQPAPSGGGPPVRPLGRPAASAAGFHPSAHAQAERSSPGIRGWERRRPYPRYRHVVVSSQHDKIALVSNPHAEMPKVSHWRVSAAHSSEMPTVTTSEMLANERMGQTAACKKAPPRGHVDPDEIVTKGRNKTYRGVTAASVGQVGGGDSRPNGRSTQVLDRLRATLRPICHLMEAELHGCYRQGYYIAITMAQP